MSDAVKVLSRLAIVLCCLGIPPVSSASDAGMRDFQDIAARLDIGGDLFLVLHTGRWLEAVLTRLEGTEAVLPASAEERDVRDASGLVRRFVSRHGISGLQGIGVSSVPLQGGMSSLKIFLARDAQDANLPFWRGLFGWQPRRLLSLDFVPADADFTWASTPHFHVLWQLLETARQELQQPSLDQMTAQIKAACRQHLDLDPATLLESLRDEILVATRRMSEQEGGDVCSQEWLVIVGTGEQTLLRAVQHVLAQRQIALENVAIGGRTMYRLVSDADMPKTPSAFSMVRAFAAVPGFFVMGSSSRIVEDALLAQRHRSGLLSRPAFVDAFRGQNMVNNGLLYISSDGAQKLRDMQEASVRMSLPAATDPFLQLLVESLAGEGARGAVIALTLANWRQGIMLSGRSGIGGTAMGSWLGSFPARWWGQLPHWLDRWLGE
ncbi:MAG: hypothetical protein ACNA71_02655 [Kiritimatiellia bacterium]